MGKRSDHRIQCDFCLKVVDIIEAKSWQSYAMIAPDDKWYEIWACEDCAQNTKKRKEYYKDQTVKKD
jgi:hypothetical protein